MGELSPFPVRASAAAGEVDALYFFIVAVSTIMTALIFFVVLSFAIKYRRRSPDERPRPIHGSIPLEITWSVIPFGIMLIMFGWGTKLYFELYTPPKNALDVYVTGKQWMWKVNYPEGQREINELHVPTGRAIRVTLASEDVIHSFFIPAFRTKHDVIPGQYVAIWFQPTKPGRYHLFCAEYCGTQHSTMGGWVTVMEPADYEAWLAGTERGASMVEEGAKLFQQFGCANCHVLNLTARCPPLGNVYGNPVKLEDGRTVIADEAYLRESILNPNAKIVAGYKRDVMPSFQGQVSEEGLLQLIAYIKSLSNPNERRP
ncbi:MAG: cytochrome c oxidase, subunit [Bryobacterales bacterium]|nr:cytochrome c oxidase, subunit [Bryobacterales bacterium]